MDIDRYTAEYASQYEAGKAGWFEQVLVKVRRETVARSLERHPHDSVLEVGCGLEPLFTYWKGFRELAIVEPSPEFCAHARRLAPDNVRVVQGFLEAVAAELGRSFSFVVIASLLHEVEEPKALLRALRDLAAPETVLHFNVPNVYSFHRLLALEMGLIDDIFAASEMEKRFQRQTRFDRASFSALLEDAGFELLDFGTYFIKPFAHAQMEQLFDRGVLSAKAIDGLVGMTRYLPDMGAEMFADVRVRRCG
jgi:SAM-dependent methyltransferase